MSDIWKYASLLWVVFWGELSAEEVAVKALGEGRVQIGRVVVDKKTKSLIIPAVVHMREGAVEYVLATSKVKAHESIFLTEVDPLNVHLGALLLGLGGGKSVEIEVRWKANGPDRKLPLEKSVILLQSKPVTSLQDRWRYLPKSADLNRFMEAPLIAIIQDADALIQYSGKGQEDDEIHRPNAKLLPKKGHSVSIVVMIGKS